MTKVIKTPTVTFDDDMEDIGVSSGTLDLSGTGQSKVDDFNDIPVSMPAPAKASGIGVMDFSAFADGIEDITAESESYIKGLLYGKNGTGKTYICGTFPGPRLFLDIRERGLKSVVGAKGDQQKRVVDTFEMFQMAYWYLKAGNHGYETVVLDNITNLQKLILDYAMGKEENWDPNVDKDMPSRREYGYLSQFMQTWIINFRNLPMNVVFIAQEKSGDDTDLESTEPTVYPQLTTSVKGIIGGAVDFIGNTFIKLVEEKTENGAILTTPRYCLRLGPSVKFVTKIRLPQTCTKTAPSAIANASYAKLKKIMEGDF
jgi:phage nucleotide-binding protein